MDNTEELNEIAEETVSETMNALYAAMLIGDYKKANFLLDLLEVR